MKLDTNKAVKSLKYNGVKVPFVSELNIAYGLTPPTDTSKLWVRMQDEPDFVESSNSPDVQVGELLPFMSNTDLGKFSVNSVNNVKSGVVCNGKLYTATDITYRIFNAIDLETKVVSLKYTSLPTSWLNILYPAWCTYKNKMYFLGGRPASNIDKAQVRIYDSETNTWTMQPYAGSGTSSSSNDIRGSTCVYNNVIYVFGSKSGATNSRIVLTFDTETYESTQFTLNSAITAGSNIEGITDSTQDLYVKDGIAYFVYYTTGSQSGGVAYKIDLNTKTVYSYGAHSLDIPSNTPLRYSPAVQVGDEFYLMNYDKSNVSYPYIFKVSFEDTRCTLVKIGVATDEPLGVVLRPVIGAWNNSIYALCYDVSSGSIRSSLKRMPYQYLLSEGTLLIQEGGKRFSIINMAKAKLYMNAQMLLLGNESGIGENVDGYLYDTKQQKWISLDGTPYTA